MFVQIKYTFTKLCQLKPEGPVIMPHSVVSDCINYEY